MSVVILCPTVIAELRKLKANAELHRFSLEQLKTMIANKETPIGDRPGFSMRFPGTGLRMVMSLEEQMCGWCWHVSVSMPEAERYPPPSLLENLLGEIDIKLSDVVHGHEENCADGGKALAFFILDNRMRPDRN